MGRSMRLRPVILAAGGILLLSLVGIPAAAAAPTPKALYTALLTSPIPRSQLPAGLQSPRVKSKSIAAGSNPSRHHVVGEVEVNLNSGQAKIVLVVFPTRGDALGNHADGVKGLTAVTGIRVQLSAPGLPGPSLIINGSENGLGVTQVSFVAGNVGMNAQATRLNSKSGDIQGTLSLARFALRHLRAVQRSL